VALVELIDGSLVIGPPKSAAGRRDVSLPATVLPDLERHLAAFVGPSPNALLFAGPKGGPLRRSNFQKHWRKALETAGVPSVHFHDLRHTGNTLTAHSGATLSDLMLRMGHASTRAARIYLHTTSARDRAVADALAALVEAQRKPEGEKGA
jgi:integrase